ncbi:hypothetical protein RB213_011223 [Colletotrichum asianum]
MTVPPVISSFHYFQRTPFAILAHRNLGKESTC